MNKVIKVINSCTTAAQLQGAIKYANFYCELNNIGVLTHLELLDLLIIKQKQLS